MTYKDSAPPGKQVVTHNRTTSDVLLETFRRPNDTEEKIPLGKKNLTNDDEPNSQLTVPAPEEGKDEVESGKSNDTEYKLYGERWWIVICVALVYGGNYCHWIAIPSVGKVVAQYYGQTGEKIDLISTLSTGIGIPLCLLATFLVDSRGTKKGIHVGASLTIIGEVLCLLSSLPGLEVHTSSDARYYMVLIGQAFTGAAAPFITCLPTKVSQHWFGPNYERTLATTIMAMAPALGLIFGHGITPLFVKEKEDVTLLNICWFIPATLGSVIALCKIHKSHPDVPPSRSALLQRQRSLRGKSFKKWFSDIKMVLLNPMAVLLLLFYATASGYSAMIATKLEQLMCSQGYTDKVSGAAASTLVICGVILAVPVGMSIEKTGKRKVLTLRSLTLFFFVSLALQAYYLRLPNSEIGIFISLGMFGGLGVGCIAPGQEVLAETTYPADQTVGLALMSLFGFVKGTFLMLIENVLGDKLTEKEMEIQVCIPYTPSNTTTLDLTTSTESPMSILSSEYGKLHPMNHSTFIYFSTGYMFFMTLLFGLFFNTKLKRTMADEGELDLKDVLNSEEIDGEKCDNKEPNIEANILPEKKTAPKQVSIELSDIKPNVKAERG